MHKKNYITVAIEGNIGSGKSTVLSYLARSASYDIIPEPVESWKNFHGHNLLELFYTDRHRWAFLFELNALRTLAELHKKPTEASMQVLERSIYCTRYCFMENLFQNGILNDVEYQMLDDEFKRLTDDESCKVDLIIYLRANPEVCLERIRARNRPEEATINLEYLCALHQRHEEWLTTQGGYGDGISPPVIIIDANQDQEQVYVDTNTHMNNRILQ